MKIKQVDLFSFEKSDGYKKRIMETEVLGVKPPSIATKNYKSNKQI